MLRPMLHEDFYASGTYENGELGCFFACVTGDATRPPRLVWNEAGTVGCFLGGEAYLDSVESNYLAATSRAFLQLYEKSGSAALEKLNGWFSGLIVDLRHKHAILFNDRYGLNRVYIREEKDGIVFSSEAKSLLAIHPDSRELDPRGLGEWFSCGCVLDNRTLFRGISLLPSGSAWVISPDGKLKKQSYFHSTEWESQAVLSPNSFCEQLEEVFPRVLKRYIGGSQPVAMSLTGGLDGRMIMAWARPGRGALPCYTFNGIYRDCADVRIARKVAKVCGQQHQTISIGDEFLAEFPKLAQQAVRISDGAMDVTGAAELYVNRLARKIAPVRLTGNYGSEILRRYVAFRPHAFPSEIFSSDFLPQLVAAERTYSEQVTGNRLSFIAFKQVPWHHYARFAVEQSQIALRSPYLDNDLVSLAFRASPELAMSLEPSLSLITQGNAMLGQIPTDRGITYPAYRIGNRVNHSIQEFLAKAEYAYDYGMPHWLSKIDKWFAPLRTERLFLGRQKFVHFRVWYRNQLSGYVKEVLLDTRSRSRSYLKGAALERLVNSHLNGSGNHTMEIHKLLSMELVTRGLLEAV
jgi:asparagine synthase (glutamine-hydrolysing)